MAVGYVLITVNPGQEYEVYQTVNGFENVSDATLLFGDYDLLIKLEADGMNDIAKTVVEQIRQVSGVLETKTLAGASI